MKKYVFYAVETDSGYFLRAYRTSSPNVWQRLMGVAGHWESVLPDEGLLYAETQDMLLAMEIAADAYLKNMPSLPTVRRFCGIL